MEFIKLPLEGLLLIKPKIFSDGRGLVYESYKQSLFNQAGINASFVQDNHSCSKHGVIRGLHFQKPPFAQAKIARVVQGAVLYVAVDLRKNSASFGKHYCAELSADNANQLFMPEGFAQGFSVLSEEAVVLYKCSNFYNKEAEGGIVYNDAELNIDWKVSADFRILSDKDKVLPRFSEYKNNPCF